MIAANSGVVPAFEYVKQCVARMERSDIRERWCGFLGCSRISLALNAGYKPARGTNGTQRRFKL